MAEDKLTQEQAAAFLGIARRTLYYKTKTGLVPSHTAPIGTGRGGRRLYYLRSELEPIKAQMIGAPGPAPKGARSKAAK